MTQTELFWIIVLALLAADLSKNAGLFAFYVLVGWMEERKQLAALRKAEGIK